MKNKVGFFLAFALATLACRPAVAQSSGIYLGVQGGLSIPNLRSGSGGSEVSSGYSSRMGPYFGLLGEFRLTPVFSLQPEVNFSSQGGKKNGQQAIPANQFNPQAPAGSYYYADYKSVAKLNYIEVPVLAKFTFPLGEKYRFMADAGPYAGFLVKADIVNSGSSAVYADKAETAQLQGAVSFDGTEDIKDQLHKLNFGIQGGVGLAALLGNGYLFLHVGGNYGLMKIQKEKEFGQNNTGAATAVIGYATQVK